MQSRYLSSLPPKIHGNGTTVHLVIGSGGSGGGGVTRRLPLPPGSIQERGSKVMKREGDRARLPNVNVS